MAELLGEQPIGSEGSSRSALRSYFVGVSFTGTPVNISELSGECWGGRETGHRRRPGGTCRRDARDWPFDSKVARDGYIAPCLPYRCRT